MWNGLCRKLDLDPEHCYRLSIMRLPQPKKRNANKYQLALKVFPRASKQYEDAMDVTYCFTDNPNDEVPEDVAIERFFQALFVYIILLSKINVNRNYQTITLYT